MHGGPPSDSWAFIIGSPFLTLTQPLIFPLLSKLMLVSGHLDDLGMQNTFDGFSFDLGFPHTLYFLLEHL